MFRSLLKDQRNRRLLSPAESCNNLTVGATWADLSTYPPQLRYPSGTVELPAIYSGVGPGYQRTVKPDLLFPGVARLCVRDPALLANRLFYPTFRVETNLVNEWLRRRR